jgi:hypothetical protein
MSRQEAERFEEALQRAARGQEVEGRLTPLVGIARQAAALAETPPSPPHKLSPGRQRFLAESARLRAQIYQRKERPRMLGTVKLTTALVSVVIVFGLLFGVGQAMADSLPGGPLYDLKLTAEEARLAWTTDLQARANLSLAFAERRLDEVMALAEQNRMADEPIVKRVEQQLWAALQAAVQAGDPAAAPLLQRLATAIQQHERTMTQLMERLQDGDHLQLQQIMRLMERVRQEAQTGQDDPAGLRERLRQGTPPVPPEPPDACCTPGPHQTPNQSPGPQATQEPGGPNQQEPSGPGPQATQEPGGPNQPEPSGPGPQATQEPGGPNQPEPSGPGSQATQEPSGPNQPEPSGPGPQATQEPGGPNQPEPSGPGSQATQEPSGPNPAEPPGTGGSGAGSGRP